MEMLAILIVIVGVVLVIVVFGDEFAEAGSGPKSVTAGTEAAKKNEQSIELKKNAEEEAWLKKELLEKEAERRKSKRDNLIEAARYADLIEKIKSVMQKNNQASFFKGEFKIETLKRIKDKYENEHGVVLKEENDFLTDQFILYTSLELIDLDLI